MLLYGACLDEWGRTNGVNWLVLEEGANHCIADHGRGDVERVELQGSQSACVNVLIGGIVWVDSHRDPW